MNRKVFKIPTVLMITALCISSCCKHHDVVIEPSIVMNVSSTATKAAVESPASLIEQSYNESTGFGVYGYKNYRNTETSTVTPTKLFDNTIVRPSSAAETAQWTYEPLRYWDSNTNSSYQFLAYWPYLNDDVDQISDPANDPYVIENNKVVILKNIPNWQDGQSGKDYMTAKQYGRYAGQDGFAQNDGHVSFSFRHLLSQLIIKGFYIGIQENTVTVTGFSLQESGTGMCDVLDYGGTDFRHDFSEAPNNTEQDTLEGANQADLAAQVTLLQNGQINLPQTSFVNETFPEPRDTIRSTISSWFMVPHKWEGIKLSISYKIADGEIRTTDPIALTLGKQEDLYMTKPGYSYIITLKFNTTSEGVTVQSVAVKDWIDVDDVIREVYNW